MDLAVGRPLDEMLEDEPGFLPELDALAIAEQVLGLLHLLHTETKRTYTDLQMKNIRCNRPPDNSPYHVTIIDWNHVSPQQRGEIPEDFGQADLARFGAYLYRMLTGKAVGEKGEHKRILERRAGEQWSRISFGARQILVQALHPNPKKRFANANTFRQAIIELGQHWREENPHRLLHLANKEAQNKEPDAIKVEILLDLARLRGVEGRQVTLPEAGLANIMSKGGFGSKDWRVGRNYYRASQWQEAKNYWQRVAEDEGYVEQWRWVTVAKIGFELGSQTFLQNQQKFEAVLHALEDRKLADARAHLDELQGLECVSLDVLRAEVSARENVISATRFAEKTDVLSWGNAAQAFQRADTELQSISYGDVIREDEGWSDLRERAEALTKRVHAREQEQQTVDSLTSSLDQDFREGVEDLQSRLQKAPDDAGLVAFAGSMARRYIDQEQLDKGIELLDVGILYGQAPEVTQQLQAVRRSALKRQQAQVEKTRIAQLQADARSALDQGRWMDLENLAFLIPQDVVAGDSGVQDLVGQLRDRWDKAYVNREVPVLKSLRVALAQIDPDRRDERNRAYTTLTSEVYDEFQDWRDSLIPWIDEQRRVTEVDYPRLIAIIASWLELLGDDENDLKAKLTQLRDSLQLELDDITERREKLKNAAKLLEECRRDILIFTPESLSHATEAVSQAQMLIANLNDKDLVGRAASSEKTIAQLRPIAEKISQAEKDLSGYEDLATRRSLDYSAVIQSIQRDLDDAEREAQAVWRETLADATLASFESIEVLRGKIAAFAPSLSPNGHRTNGNPSDTAKELPATQGATTDQSRTEPTTPEAAKPKRKWYVVPLGGLVAIGVFLLLLYTAYTVFSPMRTTLAEVDRQVAGIQAQVGAASTELERIGSSFDQLDEAQQDVFSELRQFDERIAVIEQQPVTPNEPAQPVESPIPTTAPTEPPPVEQKLSAFLLAPLPEEQLFDLPALPISVAEGATETARVNEQKQLVLDVSDNSGGTVEWIVEVLVDGAPQIGTTEVDGEGFVWSPSQEERALGPGDHVLRIRATNELGGIQTSDELRFLVAAPAQANFLGEPRLRSEPRAIPALILPDQPLPVDTPLAVLGKRADGDYEFLLVRGPDSRQTWWIWVTQTTGLTTEQVSALPVR